MFFEIDVVVRKRHPLVSFKLPQIVVRWHLYEPSWMSQARQLCFLKLMLSCVKDTRWFLFESPQNTERWHLYEPPVMPHGT